MHQPASCCNATATFVGHHWFWLPASYSSSLSLLQMFTGPMPQLHFQSGAFSSSSSSSSSLPGSMQEHMRCTSQPAAAMPQLHLWAIIGSGYQPAMRAAVPCCRCSRDPVGHHWFWLPASYASSPSLLQMFTGLMPQLHFQSGAFSSSSSSSSLPGSMQEHMR